MKKTILRWLVQYVTMAMGIIGFSMILGAAMAGFIAEGKDINVFVIIGAVLLFLAPICRWVCKAVDISSPDLSHITFPDSQNS